jgi:hypothetical protein
MSYQVYSLRNQTTSTDVYNYEYIPESLKNQIYHIINETFGYDASYGSHVSDTFGLIEKRLLREHGLSNMSPGVSSNKNRVLKYLKEVDEVDKFLDVVEICFRLISLVISRDSSYQAGHHATINAFDAVAELNDRFQQNSVGYQFVDNIIIRISNQLLHNEIVLPAVQLINNEIFANANEEYIKAHKHFKDGLNKECLNECLKALESTLKIIFTQKEWVFHQNSTLTELISIAYTNGLIPQHIQAHLGSVRAVLTSGVNSIRNKVGGHGQGPVPSNADDETTRFTLNLSGSYIIYLIELSQL